MLASSQCIEVLPQAPVMNDLRSEFEQAARDIKRIGERPDNDTLLLLYAYYKQGCCGDVCGCQPGFFDFIGTAKQEAWTKLKGISQEEAMRRYIALVQQLLP
jgi:diazepam-binding inhibitor (GABA receptor modulator, acyl-CoA-binding protein)